VKKFLLISAVLVVLAMIFVGCAKNESADVKDSITGFVSAYNAGDYDQCLTYLLGITDENKDTIKTALAAYHGLAGDFEVNKIENVTVNESTATATITFTIQGQTQTKEMTLNKVDNTWKMSGDSFLSQ
jgi:hypothetical protein